MENKKDNTHKVSVKNISIITLLTLLIIVVALVGSLLIYTRINYDTVCSGVYLNDLDIGSLSKDSLNLKLQNIYNNPAVSDKKITFTSKNMNVSFSYSELGVKYDLETIEKNILSFGKDGNIFQNAYDIISALLVNKIFTVSVTYDKTKFEGIITNLYATTCNKVIQPFKTIKENELILNEGTTGEKIDKEDFIRKTESVINSCVDGSVIALIIDDKPQKLDAEKIYTELNKSMKNAFINVVKNKIVYIPEIIGIQIDKTLLISAIEKLYNDSDKLNSITEISVPITTIYPKTTVSELKSKIFRDVLGEYTTQFYQRDANEVNRASNIRIATAKINGKIFNIGEEFSYNNVVGERTINNGYKNAYIYQEGKIVLDLGGGICQVSSTLYNAVLYAGLKVTERDNHMFTVTYVPYGRDATVFYGATDFRFINSTKMPIKIIGYIIPGNRLYFKIMGTNENINISYDYTSIIRSTTNYATDYINDSNLYAGYTRITQLGHQGHVVDVYKYTKKNGKTIKKEKISTSIYKSVNQQVVRGTKKAPPKPTATAKKTPKPTAKKTPTPTVTPIPTPTTSP